MTKHVPTRRVCLPFVGSRAKYIDERIPMLGDIYSPRHILIIPIKCQCFSARGEILVSPPRASVKVHYRGSVERLRAVS